MLREKDNNGIYLADGYAAKLEYPLDESSVLHAAERFRTIYETYLSGTDARIYEAVIPDKGAFLAAQNGYPSLDYSAFSALLQKNMPYAEAIDLMPVLSLNSYYRTDLHWRQEAIVPVASQLAEAMGVKLSEKYDTVTADTPFYGVYCGQSALPLAPDTLRYLTSETLLGCTVYDYETGSTGPVYDLPALEGGPVLRVPLRLKIPAHDHEPQCGYGPRACDLPRFVCKQPCTASDQRLCEDHTGRYPLCAAGAAWPLADVRFTGCPVPLQRLRSQSQRNPQIKNARRPVMDAGRFACGSAKTPA